MTSTRKTSVRATATSRRGPTAPVAAQEIDPQALDVLTHELRLRLLRVAQALRREERHFPVSTAQRVVLRWLMLEPLRVSDLARAEQVSLPTMTEMVQRMVQTGWIEREGPSGKYNNFLHITPKGREIVQQAAKFQNANLRRRLDLLDADELAQLPALLPILDKLFVREPWR